MRLSRCGAGRILTQSWASSFSFQLRAFVACGVRQLVVAGGETAGACVQALGVSQMKIGPQIDPGVPWCHAATDTEPPVSLHLALKSGNFGGDDFFAKAFAMLA